MRELRKFSPEKKCQLEYDRLRVDGKIFIFREVQFTSWFLENFNYQPSNTQCRKYLFTIGLNLNDLTLSWYGWLVHLESRHLVSCYPVNIML